MARPIPVTPALPHAPSGVDAKEVAGFCGDLNKALFKQFAYIAQRSNGNLPEDGSEAMTAPLNLGDHGLLNIASSSATGSFYEEGAWTPTLTFATPGDLSVAYAAQSGAYVRIGKFVLLSFDLQFTPTFTTASGTLYINGSWPTVGSIQGAGVINATTNVSMPAGQYWIASVIDTTMRLVASGASAGSAFIMASNIASGISSRIRGSCQYIAA